MHDNNKRNSLKHFLRDKGYYIVALVCALAVGISGYVYFSREEQTESRLASTAVPQIVEEPADEAATPPAQRNAGTAPAPAPEVKPEPEPAAFTMVMPVEGDLIRPYSMEQLSYDPTTRDWRTHDGIDICSGVGTEVRAAADGTVASIYEDEGLGTVVTISHDGGYMTRYANLEPAASLSAGSTVRQGDPIGFVSTGALMEAGADDHLHFELCRDAVSLNPADYFAW